MQRSFKVFGWAVPTLLRLPEGVRHDCLFLRASNKMNCPLSYRLANPYRSETRMARELVDDGLRAVVQPLLPVPRRRTRHPGRKRLEGRRVLTGILFVPQSGIPWEMCCPGRWAAEPA